MILAKRIVIFTIAVIAASLATLAVAKNPFQTVQFDYPVHTPYTDCLGESLNGHEWVTVRSREHVTPSGNYHYVEHWEGTTELVGDITGRVWLSQWVSPGVVNIGRAEVVFYTVNALYKPVIGDGPKWRSKVTFKVTVNANGELKVYRDSPYGGDVRCLGPKR